MPTLFWNFVAWFFRAILSLRYKVEIKGMDLLTKKNLNRPGGILFLPNHPAHLDPLINFIYLWPKFKMRPLVIEHIYQLKFLQPFLKRVGALSVPDFSTAVNELKIRRGEKAASEIEEGLKQRENFVVYPAGRLKNTGKELLGGASAAHELLTECPEINVVLIRTTGLWGSSFSRAILGKSPDLGKTILHNFFVLLKNFVFFSPRRKVLVEIFPNPKDFPRGKVSRIELNRYLENWYNRYPDSQGNVHESENLTLVSYSFWKEEVPTPYKMKRKGGQNHHVVVSEETKKKVYKEIQRILDRPDLKIDLEQNIAFDLGMDSLNVAELIAYLTHTFHVDELHPEDLETVASVLEIAEGGKSKDPKSKPGPTYTWPEEKERPSPQLPLGKTIPEAFLNCVDRMGHFASCGDDLSGVLSYKRAKLGALVFSRYFRKWKEEKVAVLLPATAGTYIVILALQMAGKVPVMLNWTLGARYLEEMMSLSGAKRIVSSWRFLDKLQNVQFGNVIDQLVGLEDIRRRTSLSMKLKGLFLSKFSAKTILKWTGLKKIDENDPCVILFTSGTEAAPKGVPLSHKNIISNQRSAMQCIDMRSSDVLYGILPPFHSFGFSVAGLFPLLGGIKVAFYPDPTDSFALAEGVERWKITMFCSAPSFLKGLFRAAKSEQLQSVRYFVSGAEKAPEELFERVEELKNGSKLVEGYGITECSPILTLNRPHLPSKGVGRLAPDVELITIHLETSEKLPEGSVGEICVRGPNIFHGYLGNPRSPFIEIDGKKWYKTGDIGHLDPDGSLILSGRLKRFTKVGGEMISLGAVEETLTKALLTQKRISPDLPSVAICADEKELGRPRLILFTTIDLDVDEANQILQEAKFSNLVKVSSVKKIEEIPLMGAGKTDYRKLQSQI